MGVAGGGELEGLRGGGGPVESLGQRDVGRSGEAGGRQEERRREKGPVVTGERGGFHGESPVAPGAPVAPVAPVAPGAGPGLVNFT